MTFALQIRTARKALRLTQAEVAARLDVDKQSVSNWECGRCIPWPKEQARVLALLGEGVEEVKQMRPRVLDRIRWED